MSPPSSHAPSPVRTSGGDDRRAGGVGRLDERTSASGTAKAGQPALGLPAGGPREVGIELVELGKLAPVEPQAEAEMTSIERAPVGCKRASSSVGHRGHLVVCIRDLRLAARAWAVLRPASRS
jgi:hypothetical protein